MAALRQSETHWKEIWRTTGLAVLVGTVYYLVALWGLRTAFGPSNVAALWPPNAVLLCALLMNARRRWWVFMVAVIPAELAADLPHGIPLLSAIRFLLADYVEVLAAALFVRHFISPPYRFAELKETAIFLGGAAVVGPLVGAFAGATLSNALPPDPSYLTAWYQWFMADGLTHLTITPMLCLLLSGSLRDWDRPRTPRALEALLNLLIMGGICVTLSKLTFSDSACVSALFYGPVPVLVWAAIRLGPTGTSASAVILALLTVWFASHGKGPFMPDSSVNTVFDLQLFLAVLVTPLTFVAALVKERATRERALRDSREHYRILVENAEDMVVEVDTEGRFLFVSPSYCRTFGKKREELLGERFIPLVHEEDRETTMKAMEDLYRPPYRCYVEQRAMTARGFRWFAWVDTAVRNGEGDIRSIIGVGRDIQPLKDAEAERHQLETQLNRARKMEAIGMLSGGVAHDLNNILSGVLTLPDLILRTLPPDSELKRPLSLIRQSGEKAASIVSDMLSLARGAGTSPTPAELSPIVNTYLDSLEHQQLRRQYPQVKVFPDLTTGLPLVLCTPIQIQKVVMNLVSNAVEACSDKAGATVSVSINSERVEAPRTAVDRVDPGHYVVLTVRDTGPGIDADDMERIFEPFYTRKILGRSGTGIGLTIVWNIVHDHEGAILVNSSPEGTEFAVYFPVTDQKPAPPREQENPADILRGEGQHVLVVDDEPGQREVSTALLNQLGYQPHTVPGGEEGIEFIRKNPVDLVMLDLTMPQGIDGRETYRRLREIRPQLPVVVVTGYASNEDLEALLRGGVRQFVRKPYTMSQLGKALYQEFNSSS